MYVPSIAEFLVDPPGGALGEPRGESLGGTAEFHRSCHCMQACGPPVEFPGRVRRERAGGRRPAGDGGRARGRTLRAAPGRAAR